MAGTGAGGGIRGGVRGGARGGSWGGVWGGAHLPHSQVPRHGLGLPTQLHITHDHVSCS